MEHKNFPIFNMGELARIHSTTDKQLDGSVVKICGVSTSHNGVDGYNVQYTNVFYIIELSKPKKYVDGQYWTHTVLTNSCLSHI